MIVTLYGLPYFTGRPWGHRDRQTLQTIWYKKDTQRAECEKSAIWRCGLSAFCEYKRDSLTTLWARSYRPYSRLPIPFSMHVPLLLSWHCRSHAAAGGTSLLRCACGRRQLRLPYRLGAMLPVAEGRAGRPRAPLVLWGGGDNQRPPARLRRRLPWHAPQHPGWG